VRLDPEIERLVSSVRQKEAHIILMVKEGDVSKLQSFLPWFEEWGFQAKEYYQKNTASKISSAAEEGWATKVNQAGVCKYVLRKEDCPFQGRCRFSCYPGWGKDPG
ncbi:MAG: hypothetical protein ACK53L_20230, partial [Pirellulaceae bacterium]